MPCGMQKNVAVDVGARGAYARAIAPRARRRRGARGCVTLGRFVAKRFQESSSKSKFSSFALCHVTSIQAAALSNTSLARKESTPAVLASFSTSANATTSAPMQNAVL